MAEEYLLIKKTTYDWTKSKVEMHDRGVNTEENDSPSPETLPQAKTRQNPPVRQQSPDQPDSGLMYVGKKRKSASPPVMHTHKKEEERRGSSSEHFNAIQ
jgi:hypothetical protein